MFLRRLLKFELARIVRDQFGPDQPEVEITLPRDPAHGDYATNFPLKASKAQRTAPIALAETIAGRLQTHAWFSQVSAAKPGFVNLFLSQAYLAEGIETLARDEPFFSHYQVTPALNVNVEFVSANPTGPLTVGHGRNACLGDSLARLLRAVGHRMTAEYYFNNAGRQMKLLANSLRARYLELIGRPVEFPEEGYVGQYIVDIARTIREREADRKADAGQSFFQAEAEQSIFSIIRGTLDRLDVTFDVYFNEDSLYKTGAVQAVLSELKTRGWTFETDGAVAFRGEPHGLSKDPVLVKKTGEPTYRLPDVAYHIDKLGRRYDLIIDVLGADHIDEHREVLAILKALGHPTGPIRGIIYQFVTLVREGKPVKMSTRRAEYVTLDELLDEVGPDVARFFFLSRKADTHLEFDLELAKKESQENPVFYVQYAHARLAGIFRTATENGLTAADIQQARVDLRPPEAVVLAKKILSFGDVLEGSLNDLEVTALLWYLRDLAETFHKYYTEVRVVDPGDRPGSLGRLKLCGVVKKILYSTLTTLGIGAPDRM